MELKTNWHITHFFKVTDSFKEFTVFWFLLSDGKKSKDVFTFSPLKSWKMYSFPLFHCKMFSNPLFSSFSLQNVSQSSFSPFFTGHWSSAKLAIATQHSTTDQSMVSGRMRWLTFTWAFLTSTIFLCAWVSIYSKQINEVSNVKMFAHERASGRILSFVLL